MEVVDAVADRWCRHHEVSILIADGTGVGRCFGCCPRRKVILRALGNRCSPFSTGKSVYLSNHDSGTGVFRSYVRGCSDETVEQPGSVPLFMKSNHCDNREWNEGTGSTSIS
jgi:hypothetical protein